MQIHYNDQLLINLVENELAFIYTIIKFFKFQSLI